MQSQVYTMSAGRVFLCYGLYRQANGCFADGKPAMRFGFNAGVVRSASSLLFATDQWEAAVRKEGSSAVITAPNTDIIAKVVNNLNGV